MDKDSANPDQPYIWTFLGDVYDFRWQVGERRELFLEVEELYAAKSKAVSAALDDALAEADPSDHGDVVDDYVGELQYFDHELPNIQRAAIFIMLIHFAEARLTSICEGIAQELRVATLLKDLRGSGVEPALSYLQRHSKLDLSELASDFAFLRGCKHLRNALVHSGGQLTEANTVTVKFVTGEPALNGQSTGEIQVTAGVVVKLLNCLENIFVGIHSAMEKYMRQAGNSGHVYVIGTFGRAPIFGPDPEGPNAL